MSILAFLHRIVSMGKTVYLIYSFNAVIDVIIFLVPIPMILKVQLRKKEKIIVVGLFLVGGIAVIAAIIRAALTVTHGNNPDTTWAGADLLLAATIEVLLSIICCSVPALKKLATQVFGMKGTTTQYESRTANSMPLTRRKTSVIYPASSESTEEFRPEFTHLEHKYASPHNNRVTVEAVSRDTLDYDEEMQPPPPGHIAVRTEYRQTTSIVAGKGVGV
ncbi:hypothetical protein K440DRAFT_663704 [Wilcoxina mikolae CBS 423.85]|nr:hypothetical protein K440DRAFT_663704 [Wilcoxina mikolae CBS 423.85]